MTDELRAAFLGGGEKAGENEEQNAEAEPVA